jgi:hypothetical protein
MKEPADGYSDAGARVYVSGMKTRFHKRPARSLKAPSRLLRRKPPWLWVACLAATGAPSPTALASEPLPTAEEPSPSHAPPRAPDDEKVGPGLEFGTRLFGQNSGSGLELDGRYRFRSGVVLGALGSAAYADHHYVSGQNVDDVVLSRGAFLLLFPIKTAANAQMFVRFVHGATALGAEGTQALRQTNEVGAFGHVTWGERNLFRAGVVLGADLEVAPTVELADQYQGLTVGYGYAVSRAVLIYGDGATGSTYGFNGDNGKIYFGGSLGVRLVLGKEDARGAF